MSGLPWFKCYPRKFRDGMAGLTCEERGAYATVLMLIYERGGPIPDDASWIASLTWLSVRCWTKVRAALIVKGRLFALSLNGVDSLMDERAAAELSRVEGIIEARSDAGKTGGRRSSEARSERAKLCPEKLTEKGDAGNSTTNHNENNADGQAIASGLLKQTPSKRQADIETIRKSSVSPPDGEDTGGEAPSDDPNKRAWGDAVGLLVGQGAMSADKARAFFGKLLSAHQLEARDLLSAIAEAFNAGTSDPQGYLTKAAAARGKRRQTGPPKRVGWV